MDDHTIILDLEGGTVRAIQSCTLGGTRIAVRTDGHPERVVTVRSVWEAEIDRYVQDFRACDLAGAWHGLDGAGDETSAALADTADNIAELAEQLRGLCGPNRSRRDPAALLAEFQSLQPLRARVRASISDSGLALDRFDDVCAHAADIITAHDGAHQKRPQLS